MNSDSVTLKIESLDETTEHHVIGLLLLEPKFARQILNMTVDFVLTSTDLDHLLKLFRDAFKRGGSKKLPTEKDVKTLISNEHDFDAARQKKYLALVNLCKEMAVGVNEDIVWGLVKEVTRAKGQLNKAYEIAMMFDASHNPHMKKSGPEFDRQITAKAQEIMDAVKDLQEGTPSPEETLKLLEKQEKEWEEAVQRRVPFIDTGLNQTFMLTPGITLIGGVTKSGKSTVLANLIPAILDFKPDKKVLVITCEDNLDMVATRIACCVCDVPIKTFRLHAYDLPKEKVEQVKLVKRQLADRIIVVSENTTVVENVQSILVEAKAEDYSAILLDYYQVVNTSIRRKNADYIEVLKDFGLWLKAYAQDLKIPLVMFAQLKPNDKDQDKPFSQKVQADTHIANHAHVSLEIVKAHDDGKGWLTEVYCELSRHSDMLGKIATFQFKGGKLKLVHENAATGGPVDVPQAKG